jgi:uncharacterized membrane protein YdbT with pleckstrin-like domain
MDELDKVIEPREKVIWKDKPKYAPYMTAPVVISVILLIIGIIFAFGSGNVLGFLGALLIVIIILVIAHLSFNVTHYAITNKRLIYQKGIIGRDFISVDYDKVQNASVSVGLIGLIFKTGNVKVFTGKMQTIHSQHGSRTVPVHDTFRHIEKPYDILKEVQSHLAHRKESLYSGHAYASQHKDHKKKY